MPDMKLRFDNSYAQLPSHFYARINPRPVKDPKLIKINQRLAADLGLDLATLEANGQNWFSGNQLPDGAEPLAMAYSGHQFGHFNPVLGDGRANLLGEIITPDNRHIDIQLKGSGPTPFSRSGDGRAAIGHVVREYLLSEAMFALSIPSTGSLAIVASGEHILREDALPGAILTRTAASHIRIGTFQYFAARDDQNSIKTLLDYAIYRHYPHCATSENPAIAFLDSVIEAQAKLIAKWLSVGFIHGVMNTDNMTISGETIDFGPCAFMEAYDPAKVYSSIDRNGRYAYANQPKIAQWNLARLAECLLPFFDEDSDRAIKKAHLSLDQFSEIFNSAWISQMGEKIGLAQTTSEDRGLIQSLLNLMQKHQTDFTLGFRNLAHHVDGEYAVINDFNGDPDYKSWWMLWQKKLNDEPHSKTDIIARMNAVNPLYIPRNHLVEQVIEAATFANDFAPMERLLNAVSSPFSAQSGMEDLALPATADEEVMQTFCGT